MKKQRPMLLIAALLSLLFSSASFAQETPVFLSEYDTCHISPPEPANGPVALEATNLNAPLVRVAYIIPANRTAQPNGVTYLQHAIQTGQTWFKAQMEQNGFGAKTFVFETEPDAITPKIHVVQVDATDDFLRQDLWGNTLQAASQAGISVWSPGEVWVLIPEAHLMQPDGTVIGGVALGASFGTGNSPGVAVIGSDALPFFEPALMTDDTPYDGTYLPDLGPYVMKQDKSANWFEGQTFSSVASARLGGLLHEMGHAFGLAHDYRNDTNYHGNLMFNGLRGIRGNLFPKHYPQDYTRLAYASALILNVNHYFNRTKAVTPSPEFSSSTTGSVVPQQGHVHIAFQASDDDSLSLAHLRFKGDVVAEMILQGNSLDTSFAVPYFTKGASNQYTVALHDRQGNTSYNTVQFYVPGGYNQAPVPHVRIDPPIPGPNQPITLNASQSQDVDHAHSSLLVAWDIDNDGQFDTDPTTDKTMEYLYENPGNYLIRLSVTDPAGGQTVSTPVSIRISGEQQIAVESLTLINADQDEEVSQLQNGDVIDLREWKNKTFSIQAHTSPAKIDRIQFELKGPITHSQTERKLPYALFGDEQGNFNGRKWLPGKYTLTATPFTKEKKGIALTASFEVKDDNITQPMIAWDKTYGGSSIDNLTTTVPTSDGGYLLAGHSRSNASGDKSEHSKGDCDEVGNCSFDIWIVKIDAKGNKQWDNALGGSGDDVLSDVIPTPDRGYLLAGSSGSNASGDKSEDHKNEGGKGGCDEDQNCYYDYWIVKIDEQGNKLWDKTFGGSGDDAVPNIALAPDGGYLLYGHSNSPASGDKSESSKGNYDYWIIKIDEQGNKLWDKTFGGSGYDALRSTLPTADGGYLVAGYSDSPVSGDKTVDSKGSCDEWGNCDFDYWIIKIDAEGNKQWDKAFGGNDSENLSEVIATPDGGYLLAGNSWSEPSEDKSQGNRGYSDYWIIKIDEQGNKLWDKTFGGSDYDNLRSAILIQNGYLLAGVSRSNASGDKSEDHKNEDNSRNYSDYWIIKIDEQGNKLWDKTIGGNKNDLLSEVTLIPEGYLVAGYSDSPASGDKSKDSHRGLFDYWIVKLTDQQTPPMHVASLTLINAETDQDIKDLKNGDEIRLSEINARLLSIRANTFPGQVDYVKMELQGPVTYMQTERKLPYALFGDNPAGDYHGRQLPSGRYTLTVTPFTKEKKGTPLTVSFEVQDAFEITRFTLIDATLDQAVGELSEGDVIDLALFKDHKLTIRADTKPLHLEQVVFALEGPIVYATTERYYPYALFGDEPAQGSSRDYIGLRWNPGSYTLTATPYAHGSTGSAYAISYTVIDSRGHVPEAAPFQVEVYPVPTSGVINISHEGEAEQAQMMLLDYSGNVLLSQPFSQQPIAQLDLTTFKKGIYYIKISGKEGVLVKRIVLE